MARRASRNLCQLRTHTAAPARTPQVKLKMADPAIPTLRRSAGRETPPDWTERPVGWDGPIAGSARREKRDEAAGNSRAYEEVCGRSIAARPLLLSFGNPAPAATRYGNCYWDGTPPICAGGCKPGFVVRSRKSCFSGYKVYCCEPMGSHSGDSSDPRRRSKRYKECTNLCAQCEGKPKGMVCAGVPYNRCMSMCVR